MHNSLKNKNIKIAVIGAGASGLSAAYYLKKCRYQDVTVFEREDHVGGKVFSYEYEGKTYELGAIIIGNKKNYKTLHELLEKNKIPLESFETPDVAFMDGRRYSFERYLRDNYSITRLIKALMSMLFLGIKFKKYLKNGFVDASPELFVNFKDFMHKHKIEPLADTLCPFLVGCGYGCYEEIPSIYLFRFLWLFFKSSLRLKHVTKILGRECISEITTCKNGCQEIWIAMAKELQVVTNARIESIRRKESDFGKEKDYLIEIVVDGQPKTFDRLIISSPLDEVIQFMDVSEEEKELFNKIIYSDYLVTLFKGSGFNKTIFVRDHIHPHAKGKTVAICRRHRDTNVYAGYQIAPPGINHDKLIEILMEDVERLGGKLDKVITQKHWRYFPRVSSEDLNAGFYRKIDALQGQRATYYIGSALNFETLENTVKFAKKLVEKHFS